MTIDSMTCPWCKKQITREKHSDQFVCSCGWKSQQLLVDLDMEQKRLINKLFFG